VNATVSLLKRKTSLEVLRWLMAEHGLSRRQAYRYLQEAQTAQGPLPVPETKKVFTVKLPVSLIRQVRQQARREGGAISQWVAEALRRSLNQRQGHG
jgi:predicted HicB family RNase H-like nuclease